MTIQSFRYDIVDEVPYLKPAAEVGFQEPKDRLKKMLFITMFAGIGGTSDTVVDTIHFLDKFNNVDLFWKAPGTL